MIAILLLCSFTVLKCTDSTGSEPSTVNLCEQTGAFLTCSNNEVLDIHSAFFGRESQTICGFGQHYNRTCFRNVKEVVSQDCNGKPECILEANSQHLKTNDLCHNVPKYLKVKSTCKKPQEKTVCEQAVEMLACPFKEYIIIHKAYYGRDNKIDGGKCLIGRDITSKCKPVDRTPAIQERCNLKNSCYLEANNQEFGDPCPGVFKYLKVGYTCHKE